MHERLFTPRFFVMCGFSFTVFVSAFQLLPTAPFHIIDLGGSTFASGLFLGFLTYASAVSAPLTGAIADRFGQRRILITSSIALAIFSIAYAVIADYRLLLALVIVHGVFWSGLLSASAAYMTNLLPERRRAEGIAYWGLSSVAAIAVAPTLGFWVYRHGWAWLCIEAAALNMLMCFVMGLGVGGMLPIMFTIMFRSMFAIITRSSPVRETLFAIINAIMTRSCSVRRIGSRSSNRLPDHAMRSCPTARLYPRPVPVRWVAA